MPKKLRPSHIYRWSKSASLEHMEVNNWKPHAFRLPQQADRYLDLDGYFVVCGGGYAPYPPNTPRIIVKAIDPSRVGGCTQ